MINSTPIYNDIIFVRFYLLTILLYPNQINPENLYSSCQSVPNYVANKKDQLSKYKIIKNTLQSKQIEFIVLRFSKIKKWVIFLNRGKNSQSTTVLGIRSWRLY